MHSNGDDALVSSGVYKHAIMVAKFASARTRDAPNTTAPALDLFDLPTSIVISCHTMLVANGKASH